MKLHLANLFALLATSLAATEEVPTLLVDDRELSSPHQRSQYVAHLGKFGKFALSTSANDGLMSYTAKLRNLDKLAVALRELGELGEDEEITSLNYHLHASWSDPNSDIGIGADACRSELTGGHYDPYLSCGPASGQSFERCEAIDRERTAERYTCSPKVFSKQKMYDRCEVGDLSGKSGPIAIRNGSGRAAARGDPLPALDTHFVSELGINPPEEFASVIFHIGAPRVLCARIKLLR